MKNLLLRCCTFMVLFLLLMPFGTSAQNWKQPMADNTYTFYQIQSQFQHEMRFKERELLREKENHSASASGKNASGDMMGEEDEVEAESYFQYKRWEDYMAPRVYPSGDISLPSTNWDRFQDYLANNPAAMQMYLQGQQQHSAMHYSGPNSTQSSTWTFAGPTGAPTGAGAGRVGFIRVDPTNVNNLWVGAPAGGLWKSINGGASWSTNTDFLTVIGASDVAIDPTNTQNMYLATGDGDAGDTYSIGVLKSIDGGNTWNTTGLTWTVNQGRVIRKLLINPTTPTTVMAFSNAGIWRTTNGGTSWTQVQSTNGFTDAEFMPGTPNTVYACGTTFWRSTDGGATWTQVTTGVPAAANVDRLAIAVTAANTSYIYMIAGSATNDGFFGFYRSTNGGTSFTQITVSSPSNLLGWASAGNDVGGQGWYDLVIDASPTNANEVCVGGVNIWRTTNGGTSWTLNAHWTGTGAPYVHADHHAMMYLNGTTMFEGCDGGVFKTTNNGGTWTDISNNLCIAQIYRIGLSGQAASPNYWITGHQDNGTNLKNGVSYAGTMGGDGMDCFVDRTNNNVMYGEQYSGTLNRTTNGGATWNAITTGLTGTAPWVTPWYQDPTTANTLWCGRTLLFKSTNQGTNWAGTTGALPGAGTVVDFKVAPSNNQVIYVVKSNAVYKTINGGGAWTTITGTLPVGSAALSRVDVKPTDPNTAIVTFSGYSSGNKVFKTTNGGTSWTNISTGLPNLPCNCVRYDAGSAIDAVYVGCDVGVYYMDQTFTSWQPYFTSLPNAPVYDLEIHAGTAKLRAATYGRGVWEVDIYNPGTLPPIAQFTPTNMITCVGALNNFTDASSFNPTSWSWTFPSGTPATSTAQNPTGIVWNTAGTYTVTLSCSNANGTSSTTHVVTVLGSQSPPLVEGFEAVTFLPTGWTANNINNDALFWTQATTGFTSTKSAVFDNYNLDVAGAQDEMWAPRLNCSTYSTLSMTFDVAYARYNATYSDTLQVLVSTDCGATWNSVYMKGGGPVGGSNLATAPDQTATIFVPSAAQWRNETVNLNAYAGQSSVLVIFRNRGHYGQALYVDNINITGTVAALPNGNFTASVTTACAGTPINFTDASSGAPTSWTWTFPSGTPASATTQNVTGVVWNTAGTYTVTHTATNANGTGTTTQVITILATPTVTATAASSTICSGNSTTLTGSGASTYSWMPGSLSGTTVTVTPASTTTYTVTGTAANGCTNTATQIVTVNPTPTVTATASSTTICSGNSTTITASGATTYTWMPGSLSGSSVTVTPATTTTYTVTGTSGTCTSTATQIITVNPSPTVTTTTTGGTICSGQSTSMTASGASTYAWMPGSLSGATVTVSPAVTTTYTVTGTAANGCTATSTRTITVNPTPTVTVTAGSTTICSGNSTTLTGAGASTYTWMPGSLSGITVTVTPVATTTYTVTGTSAAGCTNTATQTITVNPTPTVTVSASGSTICSGSSTTLTGSGATTYNWMPGSLSGTSVTVTPAATTTYTVTGTTSGCSSTATQLITVNPSPTVTTTATSTTICSGNSTTMTASGASTYAWMPGSLSGSSVTVTPATTTTYTVTGTAANGCTSTATRIITVNPTPTVTATASSTSICTGNSVTLTGGGATTYTWNPGALIGSPVTTTPASTTTYTVTGTSAGCTNTAMVTVTVGAPPVTTASASSSSICAGSSTTLTGSGATTYSWMPGSLSGTTVTVTPASTTTYTVTGSTGPGCNSTATITVTVNPNPTVTTTATPAGNICAGASKTLTASGASTYLWMPGSMTGTPVVVTPAVTTTYTVTGTSAAGCTGTATRTVTVLPSPTVTATASSSSICTGSSVTLTSTGANTYNWQPGNQNGATWTTNPAATTTYTVTGTGTNGCTGTATVAVTVAPPPTVTASASSTTICNGNSTTLTGAGATTYTWNPGALSGTSVTVSPAATTTYTVTGANGTCTNTAMITITVNPTPTVTASATSSSVCSGGSTTLNASGASTYNWMPGSLSGSSVTVTPASTTTYTVTGTSATGCTNTAIQTITVNPTPTVSATASSSTICVGNSATMTASGASTYNWMPGSLTGSAVTVTPAATTTYTVTGTTVAGCTSNTTQTITVNPSPTVTVTASSSTICSGSTVTLTGSGATTYTWMPGSLSGATVNDIPVSNTTYTVTGTDAIGCTNTATISVTVNTNPTVTASASGSGICSGSAVTLTSGGAVSYNWMPGNLNGSPVTDFPTSTTTYTVTGTDANGCTGTGTVTVTVNAPPVVTASASASGICNGSSVTLTASGASGYTWQPVNLTGASITDTPSATTTYTVTGTDANGCTAVDSVTVTIYANPSVAVSGENLICHGHPVTLAASGGTSYSWMPGAMFGSSVSVAPASTTTYTVTGTDVNGCTNTATFTVTVGTPPATPTVIVNGNLLTSSVTGASYQWFLNGVAIPGATAQSYTATGGGVYTVEVYDANGCGSGQSAMIKDPLGVEDNNSITDFISIAPNPSNGEFVLSFHVNKKDNYIVEIHDVLGQVVYKEELHNFSGDYSQQIDLTHFGRGAYTIRITNGEKVSVIRAITY